MILRVVINTSQHTARFWDTRGDRTYPILPNDQIRINRLAWDRYYARLWGNDRIEYSRIEITPD